MELRFLPKGGSGSFAGAFFNGYEFTFAASALPSITGARIDPATTLGITTADVTFSGNNLFLNVEGLSFNSSSYVRIDLVVEGGPTLAPAPIPEPGTLAVFGMGSFALLGCTWRRGRHVPA